MTDKPILFSGPMVRALLDGRKTQTRRVLKPQPPEASYFSGKINAQSGQVSIFGHPLSREQWKRPLKVCVGDRLWVREAWRVGAWNQWREDISGGRGECPVWGDIRYAVAIDYLADQFARKEWLWGTNRDQMCRLVDQSRADAKADGRFYSEGNYEYCWSPGEGPCRARPSIHMPRWASRLTLTVTDVRVQRVQDISEVDAIAEGCRSFFDADGPDHIPCPNGDTIEMHPLKGPVDDFHRLWDGLNAKCGFGWDKNPWVVALTFDVHNGNIDEMETDQ